MLLTSLFQAIIQKPFEDFLGWSSGIVQWIANNPSIVGIGLTFAAAPAAFWGLMWYRKVEMDTEHRQLMYSTFFFGMFAIFPVFIVNYFTGQLFNFDLINFIQVRNMEGEWMLVLVGFIIVGVYEECSKFFIVTRVDYRKRAFNRIVDGIEFSIAAALGFSFLENVMYFVMALSRNDMINGQFEQIVIARSLGSMLAHTVFSGFAGYYYGRARFTLADPSQTPLSNEDHIRHLLMPRKNVSLRKPFREKLKERALILEGLLIAVSLHALYNFLLQYNMVHLILPFIVVQYLIIVYQTRVSRNLDRHLFSLGGTTVVSRVTDEGKLEIQDPDVIEMIKRWDALGPKLAARAAQAQANKHS